MLSVLIPTHWQGAGNVIKLSLGYLEFLKHVQKDSLQPFLWYFQNNNILHTEVDSPTPVSLPAPCFSWCSLYLCLLSLFATVYLEREWWNVSMIVISLLAYFVIKVLMNQQRTRAVSTKLHWHQYNLINPHPIKTHTNDAALNNTVLFYGLLKNISDIS